MAKDPKAPFKFVVRGGEVSAADDLPGHLALALRLENIGVFLGAGASVAAGGKTMKQLWDGVQENHADTVDWLQKNHFLEDGVPNIEELLSSLAIAKKDADRRKEESKELESHMFAVKAAVVEAAFLQDDLWADRSSSKAHNALEPYHRLLARLQGSRQPGQAAPWLFTTNYDLSVEWAAEALGIHVVNGFAGLHDRRFQPNAFDLSLQNTRAAGEARFGSYNLNLVKVHGSLNWTLRDDGEAIELPCDTVKPTLDSLVKREAEKERDPVLIQPTTAKYVDTIGFIYGELIRRFTEFLSRPNTTLIVSGYGFKDDHINRLLASGLLNPTLQLIIYFSEWDDDSKAVPNEFLQQLRDLESPRIIICGGGEEAYFDRMTNDLPDPAMVDEMSQEAKRVLSQIAKNLPSQKSSDE